MHELLRGDVRHTYSIRGVSAVNFVDVVFALLRPAGSSSTWRYFPVPHKWVPGGDRGRTNFLLNRNRLQLPLGYCKWGVWFCPRSGEHFQEVMRVLVQSCHG